eukprot:g36985.t1
MTVSPSLSASALLTVSPSPAASPGPTKVTNGGMSEFELVITVITNVCLGVFVVCGMASLGFGLTLKQIYDPLNCKSVSALLVVNFFLVPMFAWIITLLLPAEPPVNNAIMILGCVAGAPFIPLLSNLAEGDPGLGVGCMVLLMVVTVFYAPGVIPALIQGAEVSAGKIALSLFVVMLLPLAVCLFFRARYDEKASKWSKPCKKMSNIGIAISAIGAILLVWKTLINSFGHYIWLGSILLAIFSMILGYATGCTLGYSVSDSQVMMLATAQRNISAGLLVAASLGEDTVVYTLVGACVIPAILILTGAEIGRRKKKQRRLQEAEEQKKEEAEEKFNTAVERTQSIKLERLNSRSSGVQQSIESGDFRSSPVARSPQTANLKALRRKKRIKRLTASVHNHLP